MARELQTSGEAPADVVDLEKTLDHLSLRGRHLWVVMIMAAVLIADGFDIILLGFVAPAVSSEFGLSHAGMGVVLTASLIGVAVGGFVGGYCGDRKGRRTLVVASLLIFGLATVISAVAQEALLFSASRLVAGIGLGAATPNAAALMTELLPARWRSQIITIVYAISTIGTTMAGVLARQMISQWGWRGLFWAGALFPLAICALVVAFVPESPRFLLSLKNGSARAARALNQLLGRLVYSPDVRFYVPTSQRRGRFADIFSPGYLGDTICLGFMMFMILFAWVALGNWGTIVITSLGYSLRDAVSVMLGYNLAGAAGAVLTAFLLARLGSRRIFSVLAVVSIITAGMLAFVLRPGPVSLSLLLSGVLILGASLTALLQAGYPVVANAYPTDFRALGLGSVFGFGRLGAVSSSMITALLVTTGGASLFFFGVSVASCGILAATLAVRRHISPRNGNTR